MPNWCSSVWFFTGDKKDIDEIEATKLDFDAIMPMPKILDGPEEKDSKKKEELKKEHGHDNWYDWCCDKWGTKWPARGLGLKNSPDMLRVGDEKLIVSMDTAWSLPNGIITTMANDHPFVRIFITCMEEALFFGGSMTIHGGKVSNNIIEPTQEDYDAWFRAYAGPLEELASED